MAILFALMEVEVWESSSGGTSDPEVHVQDPDDDPNCNLGRNSEEKDSPQSFVSLLVFVTYCFVFLRKDVSKARWNDDLGMAEVVEMKGRLWTTTGIVCSGKIYCSIEETLYLAEVGALHLLDNDDAPLPLSNIYKKVAEGKSGCCWESFQIYRHIKSLGYIVRRRVSLGPSRMLNLQGMLEMKGVIHTECEETSSIIELFDCMHINEARLLFDVYHPNSKFKKCSPSNPSFVLCLTSGHPPSKLEVEDLERECNSIPLKFCQVEHGLVSFFSFGRVELPVLPWLPFLDERLCKCSIRVGKMFVVKT